MTGNRIRDSKRNPFFQVKVKDGKYSTENLKMAVIMEKNYRMIHFPLMFPIRKYRRIWMNSER